MIHRGAAVGEDGNGYARPLQAGDPFLGFAMGRADNAAGAAGDRSVRVRTRGRIAVLVHGSTDRGVPVAMLVSDAFAMRVDPDAGWSVIGFYSTQRANGDRVVAFDAFWARLYYQAVADAAP